MFLENTKKKDFNVKIDHLILMIAVIGSGRIENGLTNERQAVAAILVIPGAGELSDLDTILIVAPVVGLNGVLSVRPSLECHRRSIHPRKGVVLEAECSNPRSVVALHGRESVFP